MKKKGLVPLLILSALGLAQPAQAVVTVFFEQENPDTVRVSWSGSLALDIGISLSSPNADEARLGPSANFTIFSNISRASAGVASVLPLMDMPGMLSLMSGWGFDGDLIYWRDSIVSSGTAATPEELTFDPNLHIFTVSGTLADLGADSFSGETAWTADGTGDTIVYRTVPEPTSILLSSLGLGFISLRRRR